MKLEIEKSTYSPISIVYAILYYFGKSSFHKKIIIVFGSLLTHCKKKESFFKKIYLIK